MVTDTHVTDVMRELKMSIIATQITLMEQGAPMGAELEAYLREHNLVLALDV